MFGATVPKDRVYVGELDLRATVTKAGWHPSRKQWVYEIFWPAIFAKGPQNPLQEATLIHELVHVWQGENGAFPHAYMGQSAVAQLGSGVADIVKSGKWKGWAAHRSTAYVFTAADIGKNWNEFNVEQQGNLVESWFMSEAVRQRFSYEFGPGVGGGGRSEQDPRWPYIRDVIQGSNRHAKYKALTPAQAVQPGSGLAPGGDPEIKRIQDKLVALGYLHPKFADGTLGRSRSATLDAVHAFQLRNGLKPDRILGGPNSLTRKKLALPLAQLVRA